MTCAPTGGPSLHAADGLTPGRALALVGLIWAAVFLPALGSLELKGEEARRILPAVAMLEGQGWIVPQIAGTPYLRKPPLLNWAIAAAFQCTGMRNEWGARLPSALAVLALGIGTALLARPLLGGNGAFVAAVFTLLNFGMIDKGRLAEIDALYSALCGLAMLWWLHEWRIARRPWRAWLGAGVLLGLGALAKGPLHLLFFYGITAATLWSDRSAGRPWWRAWLQMPHLAGLLLAGLLFAAWAVPYFQATAALDAVGVWRAQSVGRLEGRFDAAGWALNLPRAAGNWLPWLVFLPLLRHLDPAHPHGVLWRAMRNVTLGLAVAVLLVPGALPRYVMPLTTPLCLLLAVAVCNAPVRWRERWRRCLPLVRSTDPATLAAASGAVAGVLMLLFALVAVPQLKTRENVRPIGQRITALVPDGATLHVLDAGFQPPLFYVKRRMVYLRDEQQIPDPCPWLLVRAEKAAKALRGFEQTRVLAEFPGEERRRLLLAAVAQRRKD